MSSSQQVNFSSGQKSPIPLIVVIIVAAAILFVGFKTFVSVPAGHRGVATLFGSVQENSFSEGLHFPVNPLYNWTFFDVRQYSHSETASVPSQDQLQTMIDVSVQFRLIGDMAPEILRNTGTFERGVQVHLVPKVRSLMREQGKSIVRAEDFFLETTQERLQTNLLAGLSDYLQPKGIEVQAVLIRHIQLPPFIMQAIEAKKEREQEVEKQKAELERFRTEQQQLIAAAEAQREAAEQEAERRRLIADAQAYEIEKLNEAIAGNPAYIQIQALEALKAISQDPASKLYFMDGTSSAPLPLMNLGEAFNR